MPELKLGDVVHGHPERLVAAQDLHLGTQQSTSRLVSTQSQNLLKRKVNWGVGSKKNKQILIGYDRVTLLKLEKPKTDDE